MPRPPLSDSRKTDRTLRIRLTDLERAALDAAAYCVDQPVSTWARDVLIAAAQKLEENARPPAKARPRRTE